MTKKTTLVAIGLVSALTAGALPATAQQTSVGHFIPASGGQARFFHEASCFWSDYGRVTVLPSPPTSCTLPNNQKTWTFVLTPQTLPKTAVPSSTTHTVTAYGHSITQNVGNPDVTACILHRVSAGGLLLASPTTWQPLVIGGSLLGSITRTSTEGLVVDCVVDSASVGAGPGYLGGIYVEGLGTLQ